MREAAFAGRLFMRLETFVERLQDFGILPGVVDRWRQLRGFGVRGWHGRRLRLGLFGFLDALVQRQEHARFADGGAEGKPGRRLLATGAVHAGLREEERRSFLDEPHEIEESVDARDIELAVRTAVGEVQDA